MVHAWHRQAQIWQQRTDLQVFMPMAIAEHGGAEKAAVALLRRHDHSTTAIPKQNAGGCTLAHSWVNMRFNTSLNMQAMPLGNSEALHPPSKAHTGDL